MAENNANTNYTAVTLNLKIDLNIPTEQLGQPQDVIVDVKPRVSTLNDGNASRNRTYSVANTGSKNLNDYETKSLNMTYLFGPDASPAESDKVEESDDYVQTVLCQGDPNKEGANGIKVIEIGKKEEGEEKKDQKNDKKIERYFFFI